MSVYQPPLRDIGFVLEHIVDLESLSKLDGYQHADPGTVSHLLEEAGRFFSEVVAPLNPVGDAEGSRLTAEGTVKTPTGSPRLTGCWWKRAGREFPCPPTGAAGACPK